MKNISGVILSFLLVISLGLVGCSTEDEFSNNPIANPTLNEESIRLPDQVENQRQPSTVMQRPAWERWDYGRDREQKEFTDPALKEADQLVKDQKPQEALTIYQRSLSNNMPIPVKEALLLRIAGLQLTLDHPQESLRTLTDYYRKKGLGVAQVDPDIALLFAYAYGRDSNFNQSLAWFNKINADSTYKSAIQGVAEFGTRRLLGSTSHSQLEQLADEWQNEPFIATQIARERKRRLELGMPENVAAKKPFWEEYSPQDVQAEFVFKPTTRSVAVLLPLSGRYKVLGENMRRGIEIAYQANLEQGASELNFIYQDVADSQGAAEIATKKLIQEQDLAMIIGPLFAEGAEGVVTLARAANLPVLSFAKSANFPTGAGVFRLAPTARLQSQSLLKVMVEQYGLRNFAIFYPNQHSGLEFSEAFRAELNNLQLEPLINQSYPAGDDAAIIKLTDTLAGQKIDALFIPGSLVDAAHIAADMSEAQRSKISILGNASWDSARELAKYEKSLQDVYFVSLFNSNDPREIFQKFIQTYQERNASKPDFFAAQGFDAATMVLTAYKNAIKLKEPMAQAFQELGTYQGLTGTIEVQSNGELSRLLPVVQFRKGRIVQAKPLEIKEIPENQTLGEEMHGQENSKENNQEPPQDNNQEKNRENEATASKEKH